MKESIFARAKKARESKKGFTLVELIVVLVILAILAAILVPALLGWIDKAKEKQIVLEARNAYLACQEVTSEDYAKKTPTLKDKTTLTADQIKAAEKLADVAEGSISNVVIDKFKVTGLTYTTTDAVATFANETWTVTKK